MTSFDLWQQAFSISLLANAASQYTGTVPELEQALTTQIHSAFVAWQPSIGSWQIAWGPAVFQAPDSQYADNAIFVAVGQESNNPVYVVATAATNANSTYDWFKEDFDVAQVVPWTQAFSAILGSYGTPAGISPYLSAGTTLGVNTLLGLQSGSQTLWQYLSSVQNSSATLIFAGHSLAGALSPTLALALFNPQGGKLSLMSWAHVHVYPSAGATPGNKDFSTFFNGVFAPVPAPSGVPAYQTWNQNVWNTLDVVPYAWQLDTLAELPLLYGQVPFLTLAELIVIGGGLIVMSEQGAATAGPYTQLATTKLVGTLNPPNLKVTTLQSYLAQAVYQHVTEYQTLLGVQTLQRLGDAVAGLAAVPRRLLSRQAPRPLVAA